VTLADVLPPEPVQVSLYVEVLLTSPVESVPEVGSLRLKAPESAHEVAFVVFQLNVLA
jgi:hypothetical protein